MRRLHRRKPDGPHPFAQPTIAGFSPAQFRADRLEAGYSLSALARESGVGRVTLLGWERGEHLPSRRLFPRVLDVLWGEA